MLCVRSGWFACSSDRRADEFVEVGKLPVEVGVAACEDLILMVGAHAAARAFCVSCVDFFDDVHALAHSAEGGKGGFAVVAGGVIAEVDVDLSGAVSGGGV